MNMFKDTFTQSKKTIAGNGGVGGGGGDHMSSGFRPYYAHSIGIGHIFTSLELYTPFYS